MRSRQSAAHDVGDDSCSSTGHSCDHLAIYRDSCIRNSLRICESDINPGYLVCLLSATVKEKAIDEP